MSGEAEPAAADRWRDWLPVAIRPSGGGLRVEWANFEGIRFTDSFYVQTVDRALRTPGRPSDRRETPIEFLTEPAAESPGIGPHGFIFHPSRSGSTVVSRMLAALPQNIVISEPPPLDQLLQLTGGEPAGLVGSLIRAWARPRNPGENRFYLKFDSWQVRLLPVIRQAFPHVPWIFVFRDPTEILVSQRRLLAGQMVPGVMDPRLLGLEPASVDPQDAVGYCARVLAQLCESALAGADAGRGLLVHYRELPGAVVGPIARHFGAEFSPAQARAMAEAARSNVKNPSRLFLGDSDEKRREADEEIRAAVRQWLEKPYEKLERLRQRQGS